MKKIPVILDVDTGLDDALAILLASYSKKLNLIAIMAVNGNASIENTYRNTCAIASYLKLQIPIGKGCANALYQSSVHAFDAHGSSGLGDIELSNKDIQNQPVLDAINLYVKLLSEATQAITIIATGPLTNLATLLLNHPELKPKIKQICFMGGSFSKGNISPYAEFNVYCDPEACKIVLESKVPLAMIPLDVTRVTTYKASDLTLIQKGSNPTQAFYIHILEYYLKSYHARTGLKSTPLHDSSAVAYVCHPEWFTSGIENVCVDVSNNKTRGQTHITRDVSLNVNVIQSADKAQIVQMTIDSISWLG